MIGFPWTITFHYPIITRPSSKECPKLLVYLSVSSYPILTFSIPNDPYRTNLLIGMENCELWIDENVEHKFRRNIGRERERNIWSLLARRLCNKFDGKI